MTDTTKPSWTFKNQLDQLITTHDATTAENYRSRHDLFTEVTDTPTAEAGDDQGQVKPYDQWLKGDLEKEIESRNDARGDEDVFVDVADPGNKPELVAALEADDARTAGQV